MLKFITLGGLIYKIPGVGPLAQRMAAELVKNGGKIIRLKKGQTPPNATTATAANVAKAVKNLKKSNTGAGRPTGKKPGSNVKKKNETVSSSQQAVSTGGKAKKGGLKTKKREIPANVKVKKIPKNAKPFNKKTQKQKDAQKKREEAQAQNSKNDNRRDPSRDAVGKYNKRGVGRGNVPKSGGAKKGGLKSRLDAKAKRTAMGVGLAAVKVDNLSQSELDIGPRTPLPKKAKNPSAARKKPMQNKRSLKRKAPPEKKPVTTTKFPERKKVAPKKTTKKDESFGAAFKRNRAAEKPTFPWKDPKTGKTGKYTTRLKEESIKDHKKKFGVTGKY